MERPGAFPAVSITLLRSPDAAQRVALREAVRCRAGAVTDAGASYDPGSAKQRKSAASRPGNALLRRLDRLAQYRIVGISPGSAAVEGRLVRRIQRRAALQTFGEIRVGDVELAERDQVGRIG